MSQAGADPMLDARALCDKLSWREQSFAAHMNYA